MGLKKLARVFRILRLCSLLIGATPAHAMPKLQTYSVELLGYVGDGLKVEVTLPCGGTFFGLVAATDTRASTLKLAAAVAQDSIVCTSLPEPTEILVDYLAVSRFKTITAMNVAEGQRLTVDRIDDLSGQGGQGRLTAVYEPRCGRDMGTLIHRAGATRLELAFVETHGSGVQEPCSPVTRTRKISVLDAGSQFTVAALRDKPKSLGRAYSLELAAVRPGSLKRLPGGGLSVAYQRACNEAPVGVVLGAPSDGNGREVVRYGVLVARFYNVPCHEPAAGWAALTEPDLALPAELGAIALAATDDGVTELSVRQPTRLVRGAGEVEVGYLGGCGEAFGVYSHDRRGALAVGVLSGGSGSKQCKKPVSEVSLAQPYVASSVPPGELYPMKLKGAGTL
jgi:hypothetical protein